MPVHTIDPRLGLRPSTGLDPRHTQPSLRQGRRYVAQPVSSFVGRDSETEHLSSLLRTYRLVTLTGPAGIGKTRLAVEVAARMAAGYAGGASLVELGDANEPDAVLQRAAAAVRAGERPCPVALHTVIDRLGADHLLLVLDGCEHVIKACADLAHAILAACPGVAILATSQQPLGVADEQAWQLPPLSLSDDARSSPHGDDRQRPAALALFYERATAVYAGFTPGDEADRAIADICRRLDGVPLAIELAAARTRVLSPCQIADRLDHRFDLLTGGARGAGHRSLRSALDRSHEMLSATEGVLLARLSVFDGGSTLEAATEVCGKELRDEDLLACLTALVAKSWVLRDSTHQEPRYRLTETVRHYASEKLDDAGERLATERHHAEWCLGLAERSDRELTRGTEVPWLEVLDAERANMRAALGWALREADGELGLRLAGALAHFWRIGGHLEEGSEWLDKALSGAAVVPVGVRTKALRQAAALRHMTGDRSGARELLEQAVTLSRQAGDGSATSEALSELGTLNLLHGDRDTGLPMLDEAVAVARSVGDDNALATSLLGKGRAHLWQHEPAAAQRCLGESLELARRTGRPKLVAAAIVGLSSTARFQGDLPETERLLTEALAHIRKAGGPGEAAPALALLAQMNHLHGDYAAARALAEEGVADASKINAPFRLAVCLGQLARVSLAEGDATTARRLFEQAIELPSPTGSRPADPVALIGLGEALLALGDAAEARARLEQGLALTTEIGDRPGMARALHRLGELAQRAEQYEEASSLLLQALGISKEINDLSGLVDSLEALGYLSAVSEWHDHAARLLGAAQALRDTPSLRYVRPRHEEAAYAATLEVLCQSLGNAGLEAALAEGRAMSRREAVAYASRRRRSKGGPTTGWRSLSGAEREVVSLVQQRLTNAEIGQRLFISPRTVQTHLTHIFAKLGLSSRRELAEEATRQKQGGQSTAVYEPTRDLHLPPLAVP